MTFDPVPYQRFYRSENARQEARISKRLAEAREEARRLARRLHSVPGVKAVWFFGSAARNDVRSADFDLDLAVDGGDLFRALDLVDDSTFAVDLVSLERLPEATRTLIVENGIRL